MSNLFDDLREKNKNKLTVAEKAVKKTVRPPQKSNAKTQKTTTTGNAKAKVALPTRGGKNGNQKKRNGVNAKGSHKLPKSGKAAQDKVFRENPVAASLNSASESFINNVFLPANIVSQVTTGKQLVENENRKPTTKAARKGAKVGNFIGTSGAYLASSGGANKAITKGAEKMLATKAGKKATAKFVASKAGKKLGKETAKEVVKGSTKSLIEDATIGTAMNYSQAKASGKEGKELAKDMAIGSAIDLGLGGLAEVGAPLIGKALKGAKNTHVEARIVNGKVKNVRVKNTAKQAEKQAVKEEITPKIELPTKTAKQAENVKIEPKMELPTVNGKKVGKATYIKNPYSGKVPEKTANSIKSSVEISGRTMDDVKYVVKNSPSKSDLKRELKERFGSPRTVTINGLSFNGGPYKVNLNKKSVGKIVSDGTKENNIAFLSVVDDALKNADYVGSGAYVPHGSKTKNTVRFDYFESDVKINGEDYIARIDVEAFPDVNNYKTHNVEKIELIPKSAADVGPQPTAVDLESTLNQSIQNFQDNVKLKDLGADTARPNQTVKEAAKKYGTYDGTIPKATDYGKVTQGAKTMYNSPIVDKKAQDAIKSNIEEGSYWTRKTTNKEKLDAAADKIKTNGLDFETKSFENILKENKEVRSDDIAMGYQLAREHINKGNYEAAQSVLSDVCQMESEAGRTLQAMRLFNSLSPEGRVKNVIRSADKITKNTGVNINISEEMLERLRNATEEELPELRKQINIELWNQVPATFSEKLTAWRYLAMLGNPRTHIRNIVGNALYVPVVRMDNIIQTGLQKTFSRRLEKVGANKTTAILTNSTNDRELKKFAGEQFERLKKTLNSGNGKYNEELRPLDAKVFNNRLLEGAKNINSAALEAEDQLFMKLNYDSAFAQYCKANGKKVSDLTEEFIQQASEHAYNEALRSTYRDSSKLAEALSKFRNNLNVKATDDLSTKALKTAGKVVMDSALPFTKTPINILKRGISHSPLGLMKGMVQVAGAKDARSLQRAITQLSEGLTGSAVVTLGMYMGNKGLANGSLGEYNSEYKWQQLLGKQDYALNVGDYSITMDWAAPICMPFFVGVELGNSILKEGGNIWDGIESLSQIYQPVLEMSMLSGVQNLFDFANGDSKDIVKFMGNAAQNLGSQFIPTLVGQTARTLVPERKIALSTAENKLQRDTEKYIDKLENKIPGLTNTNQSFVDMFGRTDSKQSPTDYLKAGLENFLSPAYVQKKETDETALELENLRQSLGSEGKDVLPTDYNSTYTVRYEGKDYRMTENQFTEYKKIRGQTAHDKLTDLIKTSEYRAMTNDEKKKAIEAVYDEAKEEAKRKIIISMGVTNAQKYDYNELAKEQKSIVDSGTASVSEVKEAKRILSESGVDSSIAKAYALLDNKQSVKLATAMTSESAVEQATALKSQGVTLKEIESAKKILKDSGYSKSIGQAYALLDNEQSQNVATVLTSERAVQRATWLKQAGVTPDQLDQVAAVIDTNGNGSYSKDEIISFFNKNGGFSTAQKRAIFLALSTAKYSPY